ncbi:MAG: glycosyltransferase family 39 protein [Candidatus Hydrogenedentota bacterium]
MVALETEGKAASATGAGAVPGHWKLWLASILALGVALRLYKLGERSIWYDESVVLYVSKYLSNPSKFLDPLYCNDAPLHGIVAGLWYRLVLSIPGVVKGSEFCDFLIRLYPCAAGVAGVWLTFEVGRRLTGNVRAALLAAFLFAISPFQIYYAQDLRAYPLHVVLNLAAVYFMSRALSEDRARDWLGFVVALAAGIYNHFFMVWYVIALNLYFVCAIRGHWRRVPQWTAANLAVILLSVPALRMALYMSLVFDTAQETWYIRPGPLLALISFKNFFTGYSANVLAYQALALGAALAVILGAVSLRKQPKGLILFLVLGFAPIVLGILYWRQQHFPYYTHRLFIFSAVPCYWLAGHGLASIRLRSLRHCAVAALALLTVPALADHYAQRLHPIQSHTLGILYKPDYRAAAAFVEQEYRPDEDVVAHRIRYTKVPFVYYLDAKQYVVDLTERQVLGAMIGHPSIGAYETHEVRPVRLDTVMNGRQRLWLVNTWWMPFTAEPGTAAMWQWLDAHAIRELRQPFDGLDVFRYRLNPPAGPPIRKAVLNDTGYDRTPLYFDPLSTDIPQNLEDLRRSLIAAQAQANDVVLAFDLQITDEGRVKPDTYRFIGHGSDASGVIATSFPAKANGTLDFSYFIENRSSRDRRLSVNVYSSAETIEAADFKPLDGDSSVWRYTAQEPAAPKGTGDNRLAIAAALTPQTPEGKAITASLNVRPGCYQVVARVKTVQTTNDRGLATATFSLVYAGSEEPRAFGALGPDAVTVQQGWYWLPIGNVDIADGASEIRVSVSNPAGLDRAEFELDRIRFVPVGVADSFETRMIQLSPNTTTTFEGSVPLRWDGTTRVDIEAVEPGAATYRAINFYAQRGVAATR